jgi:3-dehydroquinate synthase
MSAREARRSLVKKVRVGLPGPAAHDVSVGPGLLERLAELIPPPPHARRVALVTDRTVGALYAERAAAAFALPVTVVEVAGGEDAKTLRSLESVYHRFAALPLGRDDLVVGLGGGVVTDLAGFAAATWHRGVAVAHVPTTLLGQVDAALGGKTAVNLAEGKNLVGAFHQPVAVVCDTSTLATLPPRELRSGLGEVAKYGFIADPQVLTLLESAAEHLTEIVERAVRIKARVIAADEREAGERALLNYGHTFGHAFELLTGYRTYAHGEAVALGMVAAARLGERLGVSEPGLADRTVALLRPLGLPTGGLTLDPQQVWTTMQQDKKARGGVRFVLCKRPGEALLVDQPDRALVNEVVRSLT